MITRILLIYLKITVNFYYEGGLANAFTSGLLNPIDVAKTKIQTNNSKISAFKTLTSIYRNNGLFGLWKPGLTASMTREMLSSGPRAGFYVPVNDNSLTHYLLILSLTFCNIRSVIV